MRRWLVMHTETESRPYYKYLKKKDEKKTSTLYILYLYSFVYYYYFGEFLVYIKKRQYEHCVTMKIVFLLASEWTTNENIILLIYLCQMRVYTKRMLYGYGHVFRVTWLVFKPVKLSTKLHSVRVLYDHNIYIGIHTHNYWRGKKSDSDKDLSLLKERWWPAVWESSSCRFKNVYRAGETCRQTYY